ncbi:MAG: hypothetical protein IT425_14210 [Pirellulales bacterium]|nr:hypothetical protein [Pirellulales bacterium]
MPRFHINRWTRFSLRTLFALMTLVCIVVGLWSVYVNPFRMQLQALASVQHLQGNATTTAATGPGWQRWLVVTMLGDEGYARVTSVDLRGCKVDDQSLGSLAGLRYVEVLQLDRTLITDDGLSAFLSMPHLRELHLRYTPITDRAAPLLAQLQNLKSVHLTGTKLTDLAVKDLSKLRNLETLFIRWTRITDPAAAQLAANLPDCAVYHHSLSQPTSANPTTPSTRTR